MIGDITRRKLKCILVIYHHFDFQGMVQKQDNIATKETWKSMMSFRPSFSCLDRNLCGVELEDYGVDKRSTSR